MTPISDSAIKLPNCEELPSLQLLPSIENGNNRRVFSCGEASIYEHMCSGANRSAALGGFDHCTERLRLSSHWLRRRLGGSSRRPWRNPRLEVDEGMDRDGKKPGTCRRGRKESTRIQATNKTRIRGAIAAVFSCLSPPLDSSARLYSCAQLTWLFQSTKGPWGLSFHAQTWSSKNGGRP